MMKKRVLSFFLMLTMLFVSLPIETFAISLADKEKIYRANEWQLNSAQTVINWLCTDDNFAHHKHTETFASKFTMFAYGVSNIDVSNMLFNNPSEYRKATKEILLSIINSNEASMLAATKEEVAYNIINTLLEGTADYLASDGIISSASELLRSVESHDLLQLKHIFVDGQQKEEHFNNFVLDNLAADKQEAARESVRKYFKSQKYVDDLSSITDAVSVMQDMLEIAQKSLDIFVELETYRRNNDNIMNFLKYLHTDATSEHVKSVASELYISFYNTYEQNFDMAVDKVKNIVFATTTDYITDAAFGAIVELLKDEVSVFGLFSTAAKLGIDAGKIVSDIWFDTSNTKEITASIFIYDHIATDLSAYAKKCQGNFNSSYDNIIINPNNASVTAGRYINAVQMLLDARKKGEDSYYALKDTIYSADILSIVHLFGGFDDTLEGLEKWYTQRKADFETANNTLFYYIESSQYENKYEYVFNEEKFIIENGVLVEYVGSGDSRISTPSDISAIDRKAFQLEPLLISVSIKGSPVIEPYAFYGCIDLRTVFIPETVTEIEHNAFYNCENLTIYGYAGSAAESFAKRSGIPFFAWSEHESNSVWDGSVADGFSGGRGTYESPYLISTASELAYLSTVVNSGKNSDYYYKLTKNIVLNNSETLNIDENGEIIDSTQANIWTPIGNEEFAFLGSFDGNGYTIEGLYINDSSTKYSGLFGSGDYARIKNVGLINTYIVSYQGVTGGICAHAEDNIDIDNCYVDGWLKSNAEGSILSGILGNGEWDANCTITNCHNSANIQGRGDCAGISFVEGASNFCGIRNCYNEGNISAESDAFGISRGNSSNCYNNGVIFAKDGSACGIGGNPTYCFNTNSVVSETEGAYGITSYSAQNCYNKGDVKGGLYACGISRGEAIECWNIGNIIGEHEAFGVSMYDAINCYNEGKIEVLNKFGKSCGISGRAENCCNLGEVFGYDAYGVASAINSNCINYGKVVASNSTSGIGGDAENCINYGNIIGVYDVSGIGNNGTANCTNYGEIQGKLFVGGISSTSGFTINDCINYGQVVGEYSVGGIIGEASISRYPCNDSVSVLNCTNYGKIIGKAAVGGICGISALNTGEIFNCINSGIIEGNHTLIGGIVGLFENGYLKECKNTGEIHSSIHNIDPLHFDGYYDFTYTPDYDCSQIYIGGIVGSTKSYSTLVPHIIDCENAASVSLTSDENIISEICVTIGGIVGNGDEANVIGCVNRANINCPQEFRDSMIAGVSGEGGTIQQSANLGTLYGVKFVAGIAGDSTYCLNCYNTGNLQANYIQEISNRVINCYNIGQISGKIESSSNSNFYSILNLDIDAMMHEETFVGFDFANIWIIDGSTGYEYPQLIRQYHGMPARIKSVYCWYDNNKVTAEIKFNRLEQAGTLYLAVYDEGKLVALQDKSVAIGEAENTIEIIDADEKYKDYDVKVFYWEGNSSLKPLAKSVEAEIVEDIVVDDVLESEHPYANDTDETKTYVYNGECVSIDVTFSDDTITESDWDYIYIYDANENQIGKYSGTELAGQTITVPGNTVKIRLTSDGSVTRNGYRTESIVVNK